MSSSGRKKTKKNDEVKQFINNMSKEAFIAAFSKKRECNTRAMLIIEQAIEPNVDKTWLLENLKHINQTHFQDIVVERAITKCCGYPLCDKPLVNIPRKMYKISTRENKVYDITERKNYCSNTCYKAGTFLRDQLYTSPLWIRDCEEPVEYEILQAAKKGEASGAGAEVYLGDTKPVRLDKHTCEEDESTETADSFESFDTPESMGMFKHKSPHLIDSVSGITNTPVKISPLSSDNSVYDKSTEEETQSPVSGPSHSDCLNKVDVKQQKKEKQNYDYKPYVRFIDNIELTITSWFTLNTMVHLLGQKKLRGLLKERGIVEDVPKKKDTMFKKKCEEIYKRLDSLGPRGNPLPTKPDQDYDSLHKDAHDMQLKVKSFLQGDAKVTFSLDEDEKENPATDQENPDRILPFIDNYSVSATRFKIFMDRLNKVLPDILKALDLTDFELAGDIRKLATTFNLTSVNISMKNPEWALAVVVLVRLLTLDNELLEFAYLREVTQKRLMSYLLTYDLDGGYLDRFTSYLMDIDRMMETLEIE